MVYDIFEFIFDTLFFWRVKPWFMHLQTCDWYLVHAIWTWLEGQTKHHHHFFMLSLGTNVTVVNTFGYTLYHSHSSIWYHINCQLLLPTLWFYHASRTKINKLDELKHAVKFIHRGYLKMQILSIYFYNLPFKAFWQSLLLKVSWK